MTRVQARSKVWRTGRSIAGNDEEEALTAKVEKGTPTPEAVLRAFVERFDSNHQKLFRSVRTALRKRFPTANELAYDYTTSIVISYSPDEHGIHGILSIALREDGVRLYLNQAKKLPVPKKLLRGSGKQARFLELESARQLADANISSLIDAAVQGASIPLPSAGKGELVIRTGGPKPSTRKRAKK